MLMQLELNLVGVSLPDNMSSEFLAQAAARGVSNALKRHFRARNVGSKHRDGFPRSNYWAHVADSVQTIPKGSAATVLIDHEGVSLHLKGGRVAPTRAKALAIPLAPQVADQNPREYDPGRTLCAMALRKGKPPLLVEKKTGQAIWILLKSVNIKPDPSVLPADDALVRAGLDAISP